MTEVPGQVSPYDAYPVFGGPFDGDELACSWSDADGYYVFNIDRQRWEWRDHPRPESDA